MGPWRGTTWADSNIKFNKRVTYQAFDLQDVLDNRKIKQKFIDVHVRIKLCMHRCSRYVGNVK
jgi:hypothetical protein